MHSTYLVKAGKIATHHQTSHELWALSLLHDVNNRDDEENGFLILEGFEDGRSFMHCYELIKNSDFTYKINCDPLYHLEKINKKNCYSYSTSVRPEKIKLIFLEEQKKEYQISQTKKSTPALFSAAQEIKEDLLSPRISTSFAWARSIIMNYNSRLSISINAKTFMKEAESGSSQIKNIGNGMPVSSTGCRIL